MTLLEQIAAQLASALENRRIAAEIEALKRRMTRDRKHLEGELRTLSRFPEIIGTSEPIQGVLNEVAIVAPLDSTVLILGEMGTGKELIGRAVHRLSRRRDQALVKVNCAAIPSGLLESELFGHEKGAFTGAVSQKVGRFELANHGTLFLDEVGDVPIALQPKLLRALQDQEFERLGGTRTIKVNVRIVAATNRDLRRAVSEHEFRSDLFYRLHVFPIHMPPLRDRREDIPLLVRYFVRKISHRMNRHIEMVPDETMSALCEFDWPGNVRQLENLIERSVILSAGPVLGVPLSEFLNQLPVGSSLSQTLEDVDREQIIRVLKETRGVLSGPNGAAERLGLPRITLQSKMQRLKINARDYLRN